MRREKNITPLVIAIGISITYVIFALFYTIATTPTPTAEPFQYRGDIFFSLGFLLVGLVLIWSLYFFFKSRPGAAAFYVPIVVGIAYMLISIFIWGTYY